MHLLVDKHTVERTVERTDKRTDKRALWLSYSDRLVLRVLVVLKYRRRNLTARVVCLAVP